MNQWYNDFWNENKQLIITHVILTIIILPFEIILFSVFTKKLFDSLQEKNFKVFVRLFIVFIFFLAVLQVIYALKEYIDNKITPKVQLFIRERCMRKYLSAQKDNFKNSDVMNQITNLPKCFYSNYEAVLKFWLPFFTCFLFYLIFLYWNNIHIGIMSTIVFSGLLTLFIILFQKLTFFASEIFSLNQQLLSEYENILMNNETIQTFYTHKKEIEYLKEKEKTYEKNRIKLVFYIDVVKFSFIIFVFLYLLSLFFYLYNLMLQNRKDYPPWKFVTFITMLFFVVRFILQQMSFYPKTVCVQGTLVDIEQLYTPRDINKVELNFKNYNIDINNISFHYPSNPKKVILNHFNLSIPYRSNILIKGPIGSGKSTIGRLLSLWYKPQKGSITIGGNDIYTIPKKQYKDIVYMMSQNTILFSELTIFENICYSFETLPPKNILDKYNLPSSFLKILDQKVLHNGTNISGGQKRMVHILRTILHKTPIVILDEPTDSLDENTTTVIIQLIKELIKKKTVLCISHDERLNSVFTRILQL